MNRKFDARPDKADFRDLLYKPGLINIPPTRPISIFKSLKLPILNQGTEGACTGFGLASVVHYLFRVRSKNKKTRIVRVSPRMLYEMAKKYDEWPGTKYEGSSARGAIKGWHKHGVCKEIVWPYTARKPGILTEAKSRDAAKRPLGAYYRVNPKNLNHMHIALIEVGMLYVTSAVHVGWNSVRRNGVIPSKNKIIGGHAYAIVGYDVRGFWLQNSWGTRWGNKGFARLSYSDWLRDGYDVWACRLGVPVII